eukprot:Nk52_evm23s2630 gene=Nk52_evmTU23s2630
MSVNGTSVNSVSSLCHQLFERIVKTEAKIRPYIRKTPLEFSPWLSGGEGAVDHKNNNTTSVFLKLESEQLTGSFKVRGALSKVLNSSEEERERGFVTSSTGNHALGCAFALQLVNASGVICMPVNTSASKIEPLIYQQKKNPGQIKLDYFGTDCVESEKRGRDLAEQTGKTYIPPYNDLDIMSGQGTTGFEIWEQCPDVDAVFVSVGGGGLISGIGGYMKYQEIEKKRRTGGKGIQIIGCLPEKSPVMGECVKAGKIIEMEIEETISDGTAGGVEEGSVTFEYCQKFVDEWVCVSEDEIKGAMYGVFDKHHKVVEGSAGVAVASYLKVKERFAGMKVAIVCCGSNVKTQVMRDLLNEYCV